MSALKLEIEVFYQKSTAGTHVFGNEEQEQTIYIRKDKFPGGKAPKKLMLTIEDLSCSDMG